MENCLIRLTKAAGRWRAMPQHMFYRPAFMQSCRSGRKLTKVLPPWLTGGRIEAVREDLKTLIRSDGLFLSAFIPPERLSTAVL